MSTDSRRQPRYRVMRSVDRPVTETDSSWTRHSFSFGDHYDPANTHHGLLVVHNEEWLPPGGGYDTHPHRDAEIVTWVLSGELEHVDSTGNAGIVRPGTAQRLSAGSGVRHSERNASTITPVHFVQMQMVPDDPGGAPAYGQSPITGRLVAGGLVPAVSGCDPDAAVLLGVRDATMYVARPTSDRPLTLPSMRFGHLFVTRGGALVTGSQIGEEHLDAGDAIRIDDGGDETVRVAPGVDVAEVILWAMQRRLGE
ncbi:pirin family protein [Williamsia sterculiae]|nr:pirin family protein [Williamsia sterculiae]